MDPLTTLASIATTMLLLALATVTGKCPQNVAAKVRECTAIVLPNLSSTGPAEYRDHVEVARDTCRDSRLRDVAACLQNILDECKGTTEQEQLVQRLLDKDRTLEAVEYFCKHIRVYEKHAECISNHHEEMIVCSQEAKSNFEVKLNAGAMMDTLITGSCRFYAVARGCLTNTTEYHCGQEASTFVFELMSGQMPPYCRYRVEQSDHSTRSWYTRGDFDKSGYNTENGSNSGYATSASLALVFAALGQLYFIVQGR